MSGMVKMTGVWLVGLHKPLARFGGAWRWHSPQLLRDICSISQTRYVQQMVASSTEIAHEHFYQPGLSTILCVTDYV